MTANEPMSDRRLAQLWRYAAGGNLGRSEAEELLAEVERLRAASVADAAAYEAGLLQIHADRDHWQQRAVEEWERADAAERELAEPLDALTVATELIDRLTDDGACDYDHYDNCRTHSLQRRPCPHPLGRQFVTAWRAVEAEQQKAADDDHQ